MHPRHLGAHNERSRFLDRLFTLNLNGCLVDFEDIPVLRANTLASSWGKPRRVASVLCVCALCGGAVSERDFAIWRARSLGGRTTSVNQRQSAEPTHTLEVAAQRAHDDGGGGDVKCRYVRASVTLHDESFTYHDGEDVSPRSPVLQSSHAQRTGTAVTDRYMWLRTVTGGYGWSHWSHMVPRAARISHKY